MNFLDELHLKILQGGNLIRTNILIKYYLFRFKQGFKACLFEQIIDSLPTCSCLDAILQTVLAPKWYRGDKGLVGLHFLQLSLLQFKGEEQSRIVTETEETGQMQFVPYWNFACLYIGPRPPPPLLGSKTMVSHPFPNLITQLKPGRQSKIRNWTFFPLPTTFSKYSSHVKNTSKS